MLLPYRVKNPVKTFPAVTLTIIILNIIIYIFTTDSLLSIRESVVENWASGTAAYPVLNQFTSMFLHGDPFHLLGNMLYLWVFGPPVEDRLGRGKFLLVYFCTGLAGTLLQDGLDIMFFDKVHPGIGASGCIMGVLGAYWFLFSWSTVVVFYWLSFLYHGDWEVQAIWIIGLFILLDLVQGLFLGGMGVEGGVANFAHVGGGIAGALLCLLMKAKRDTEAVSDAKAIQADFHDVSQMPVHAIETMLEEDPCNANLIQGLITAATRTGHKEKIGEAMERAGTGLIDANPYLAAHYLIDMNGSAQIYQPVHLLRLGSRLEQSGNPDRAVEIYKLIINNYPASQDTETALYRLAQCCWRLHRDIQAVQKCLQEMAKRFPNGPMMPHAKNLWNQVMRESGKKT